jgi:hypothetical protein
MLVLGVDVGDVEALGLAADIGFVGFDNGINAAERSLGSGAFHGFADTMAEEPSSLVGNAQHALHLLRAHALLGSGHEVEGE